MNRLQDYLLASTPSRFSEHELNLLLQHAKSIGASDVYLKSNRPVCARLHGRLIRLTNRRLEHPELVIMLSGLYGGADADLQLRTGNAIDNAYSLKVSRDENLRFRWNGTGCLVNGCFGISIVLRELPDVPPQLNRAEFPDVLWEGLFPEDGMVLVTGETGAGKTTFLAGVVREIAETPDADKHILTYEAPIEFVYDKIQTYACEIDQTCIPDHLGSFAKGIRNALRRDPDIILVGESRDAETIKAAVLAAQTGHVMYSTVHSNNVATTFLRLIQSLPVDEMHSVMGSIIDSIRTIVSQRLVPSTDGKRCAIREYLVFDNEMRRELLSVASQNMSMLPVKAAELVNMHGRSIVQHAREMADAGRIDSSYVDLIRTSTESSLAVMSESSGSERREVPSYG